MSELDLHHMVDVYKLNIQDVPKNVDKLKRNSSALRSEKSVNFISLDK